jgi:hypothetical protein
MAFVGSSGGEVAGPCVGLCVVAGGSRRCGSGSCVGPVGGAVLDGVCRRRGRAFVARPCVGLCMGAGVAAADHVLVLSDVYARRAYVAKEEGRSSGCSGVCHLASGIWTVCRSGHGGVCVPGDVCHPEKEAASERGETASFIAAGGARLQRQCGSAAWRKWP